jgi:hypothetical protein
VPGTRKNPYRLVGVSIALRESQKVAPQPRVALLLQSTCSGTAEPCDIAPRQPGDHVSVNV